MKALLASIERQGKIPPQFTNAPRGVSDHPNVPVELRASDELLKRIRKLRWIGLDDEARALELTLRRVGSTDPVLADRFDTD